MLNRVTSALLHLKANVRIGCFEWSMNLLQALSTQHDRLIETPKSTPLTADQNSCVGTMWVDAITIEWGGGLTCSPSLMLETARTHCTLSTPSQYMGVAPKVRQILQSKSYLLGRQYWVPSLPYLLSASTKHALYTEAHRCDVHCRTPVFIQDRETDVSVAIDVRVNRNVLSNKRHLKDNTRFRLHLSFSSL